MRKRMRCEEVRSWTLTGLVGAFLDLSLAFSLLCASALVYLTSKLFSVFGLNLPCPCDGLFSDPRKNRCFQETLVNLPVEKISSVQTSVLNTTPFDSLVCKKDAKEEPSSRHVDFEKDLVFTSSTTPPSVKDVENDASCFHLLTEQSLKKRSFKVKSKPLRSPSSVMEYMNDAAAEENDPSSLRKSVSLCSIGCDKQPERTLSEEGTLEELLAEERASRAALALELEKERNAAATAADEALGMILRLQEEKASIEMEARQYQRMIQEKSAFDAEEMSILKEILLRREREKHFLEKEVDSYRQMFLPNTPEEEGLQTPQQITQSLDDSSGFDIFTNLMDNPILDSPEPGEVANNGELKVNGVDQDPEIVTEREEGSLFSQLLAESNQVGEEVKDEDKKVKLNVPSDHDVRDLKLDRSQSVLGTSYGLPPQGQRIMSPNMRRNSMSAVDYERLKIESEVDLLRGRLRAVQKGREKISFSSKEQVKRFGNKTSRFWEPIDSSSPSSTMLVKAMSMSLDLHSA